MPLLSLELDSHTRAFTLRNNAAKSSDQGLDVRKLDRC